MKKILFVCLGNICRSSTAEGVMLHLIEEAGLEKEFVIDSAGILSYHQGELPDSRMRAHAVFRNIQKKQSATWSIRLSIPRSLKVTLKNVLSLSRI